MRQRFDFVFWLKGEDRVKAIVEIKTTWGKMAVMDDVQKVSNYLNTPDGRDVNGYVLYFTDHTRNERWKGDERRFICQRFQNVENDIKKEFVNRANIGLRHGLEDYISDEEDWDPWGFALYRC